MTNMYWTGELIFEAFKIMIIATALVATRYLIPLLKEKVGAERLADVEKWVKFAVLKAQQVMWAKTGVEKKQYVTEFVEEILRYSSLDLTGEQIDILIEAAVKQMKIEEKANESK